MKIGNFKISDTSKVFIIAELSANHNNDYQLAVDTIHAMKEAGADCVKLQTYTADSISMNADTKYFAPRDSGLWKGQRPFDVFKVGAMPYEWQPKLIELANSLGMECFSSPFDKEAIDFLESINTTAYKIASFEIQDIPLIEYAASKGKPIIISTGIADIEDIQLAVEACKKVGNNDIALLKCTSAYPTPFNEINIKVIPDLKEKFGVLVGLSDHTMGSVVPMGAVSLGAKIIEKHFVLDRSNGGVDAAFSMEPHEFKAMVDNVRNLELALGSVTYELTDKQKDSKTRGTSLFVCKDVKKGDKITSENIKAVRPAAGLHPKHYNEIINKVFKEDMVKGTPLSFDLILE
ncbi:pseudaminic acid synthase [Algibacter sp. L3A6]|uniref:pseudaminic acid synthase n=1 Tax=Algibacter sp. L3A6 TaxID=2686366 RepID=UPI00131E8435|nr:pseudaminic acid synthase [Algibacter sp. L3A6]